jgi:hypothetical protein
VASKRLLALVGCLASLTLFASRSVVVRSGFPFAQTARDRSFASEIARLSEPGGYFDTDNLVSNERSYLEVIPALERAGVSGGAYVGVGPDQNFSYIASVRPAVAFILDVRRDNLLLHLLFKALFQLGRTRVEYLSALTGRAPPEGVNSWRDATLERIVSYVDDAPALSPESAKQLSARLDALVAGFGVPVSTDDLDTIHRFHGAFARAGLSLQFQSKGRTPRSYYPTYRELLLGTDVAGRQRNFLATEGPFEFVRSLQTRDLVIPVVGNLGGDHAFGAIGAAMRERGIRLSAVYVSNVEDYLFRDGAFPAFVENLQHLPRDDASMIVRSVFGGYGGSRSAVQSVSQLLAGWSSGRFHTYWELVRP